MLKLAVFLCGAVVMVIELAGSRVLAPFLGTSLVVWTSLIGIILGAMSLGYYLGGRVADRNPSPAKLSLIILAAAIFTALTGLGKFFVLELLSASLENLHLSSLLAVSALFAPPALLLGMVAPYAVRLELTDAAKSGSTAGNLYAISTLGSIVGTFAAGFVLISYVGSSRIFFILAGVLVLAAIASSRQRMPAKLACAALFALLYGLSFNHDSYLAGLEFFDEDTKYQRVLVYNSEDQNSGEPTRVMTTGPGGSQSAIYKNDPLKLALNYTRYFELAMLYRPELRSVLMLGGGGYSVPRYILNKFPQTNFSVVELDPGITALAKRFFNLSESSRLNVIHADARAWLNRDQTTYDAVFVDVFNSEYSIPFHVATLESLAQAKARLNPGGVVIQNVISSLEGSSGRFFRAELACYRQLFKNVEVFAGAGPDLPRLRQNLIILASDGNLEPAKGELATYLAPLLATKVCNLPALDIPALSDDFAPVERYIANWPFDGQG